MVHTDFALRRPVSTLMAFAAVAVIGIVASRLLPLEQYPDVSFPFMGAGVLVVSEDLDELFELSDRLLVLFHGAIAGEFEPQDFRAETVGPLMVGAEKQSHAA